MHQECVPEQLPGWMTSGFRALLAECPMLGLDLAGCCKSLHQTCRPFLAVEELSKCLVKTWTTSEWSGSNRTYDVTHYLTISRHSTVQLRKFFLSAQDKAVTISWFQNRVLTKVPWDDWYAQALQPILLAVSKIVMKPSGSRQEDDLNQARQILSQAGFMTDMRALLLQSTADIANGLCIGGNSYAEQAESMAGLPLQSITHQGVIEPQQSWCLTMKYDVTGRPAQLTSSAKIWLHLRFEINQL